MSPRHRMSIGARVYLMALAYGPRGLVRLVPWRWRAAALRELVPAVAALVDRVDPRTEPKPANPPTTGP